MKKITKNGKEYVVLEKTKVIEEEIAVEDIQEKISALNANIVAYNATVADWEKQKKELEDYLK
jgi:wobble nucleotide-excising tRNase